MDQPTVDDDENGVRRERVEPVARRNVRDALHIGVEVPMKYMIGLLLVGAFNGGIVWVKFDSLVDAAKILQANHQVISNNVSKIEQRVTYQDEKLVDHENRLRHVERTKP